MARTARPPRGSDTATDHGPELADRAASSLIRIGRAWQRLRAPRRGAAVASVALFVTLFLPWFDTTEHGTRSGSHPQSQSFTAWDAFSFVEAVTLVVAAGVLLLLFYRAENRGLRLPAGDGGAIALVGFGTCALVVWRMFDRAGTTTQGQIVISSGISWGIFGALFASAGLAYAGTRIRADERLGPPGPLPDDDDAIFDGHWSEPIRALRGGRGSPATVAAREPRRRRRSGWRPAEQPEWIEPARPPWDDAEPETGPVEPDRPGGGSTGPG